MMITKVTYGKTFNTGNYTSERYDVEATVDPGESEFMAWQALRDSVHEAFQTRNERRAYDSALNPPGTTKLIDPGPDEVDDIPF